MLKRIDVDFQSGPETVASGDLKGLIDPVWWTADIYGSPAEYEASVAAFTAPQRHLFAVRWYESETTNGGHHQFFANPTAVLWPDALAGFDAFRWDAAATNLRDALRIVNPSGHVPRDGGTRGHRLERIAPRAFQSVDIVFNQEVRPGLGPRMLGYAQQNAGAFAFRGTLSVPAMCYPEAALAAFGGPALLERALRDPNETWAEVMRATGTEPPVLCWGMLARLTQDQPEARRRLLKTVIYRSLAGVPKPADGDDLFQWIRPTVSWSSFRPEDKEASTRAIIWLRDHTPAGWTPSSPEDPFVEGAVDVWLAAHGPRGV